MLWLKLNGSGAFVPCEYEGCGDILLKKLVTVKKEEVVSMRNSHNFELLQA